MFWFMYARHYTCRMTKETPRKVDVFGITWFQPKKWKSLGKFLMVCFLAPKSLQAKIWLVLCALKIRKIFRCHFCTEHFIYMIIKFEFTDCINKQSHVMLILVFYWVTFLYIMYLDCSITTSTDDVMSVHCKNSIIYKRCMSSKFL